MANNPFDQVIINSLELPSSGDQNQQASQIYETIRSLYMSTFAKSVSATNRAGLPVSGFIGDGFMITGAGIPNATIVISPGFGFQYVASTTNPIDGIAGLADLSYYKPLVLAAPQTITPPAAPGIGLERYDIIEVRYDDRRDNPQTINIFNLGLDAFQPTPGTQKTLDWTLDGQLGFTVTPSNGTAAINYKSGAAAALTTAVVPATSPGYVKIGQVYSVNATAVFDETNIADTRRLLFPGGMGRISFSVLVQSSASGSHLPSIGPVVAPPGVQVAVTQTDALKNSDTAVVRIKMGDVRTNGVIRVCMDQPAAGAYLTAGSTVSGSIASQTIASGSQAQLADPTFTSPVMNASIGQDVLFFYIGWTGIANGSSAIPGTLPSQLVANVTIDWN